MAAVSDEFRNRILATHELLQSESRPSGTPHVVRYLRYERPIELDRDDRDEVIRAGFTTIVGKVLRNVASARGRRTIVSVPDSSDEGRSYKQLSFTLLSDALGVLQMYESSEHAYRIQRQGWWLICERLRAMPEGTTVADLFPEEDNWDRFWDGIRASDLWQEAA